MLRNLFPKFTVVLIALLLLLGLGGCGSDSSSPFTYSVSEESFPQTHPDEVANQMLALGANKLQISSALGGYASYYHAQQAVGDGNVTSLLDLWWRLYNVYQKSLKFWVIPTKVTFKRAPGAAEETGLMVVPITTQKVPLLSLQHPTQTERRFSPSKRRLDDNQLTYQYALVLASMGYLVVAPDYPGMGSNEETHPYCLRSLGSSVAGIIRTAIEKRGYMMDGRIVLMGFSEGGYATVAGAAELQQNHPELNVIAVAPLDGPHSLSDTMRTVMKEAGKDFTAPYFLPYVIAGYGAAYPNIPELAFKTAVISTPATFADQLHQMLKGDYNGTEISDFMRTAPNYNGPITVTSSTFQTALNTDGSALNKSLLANNSYQGWTPKAATSYKFFHLKIDDLVPVGNSEKAVEAWQNLSNVNHYFFDEWIDYLGSKHAGALIPAYIYGTDWLNSIAKPLGVQ